MSREGPFKLSKQHAGEATDLVCSGDIDLQERRKVYEAKRGFATPLSDQQLTVASMTMESDDDEFCDNVDQIVKFGFELTDDEPLKDAAE